MSTQAAAEPVNLARKEPPPSLRHYMCKCQAGAVPSMSICGLELRGAPESARNFKPMELCGMCQLMRQEHVPCKHCGEPL